LFRKTKVAGKNDTIVLYPWKDVRVQVSIENAHGSETTLSPAQLTGLKLRLLQGARFIPVSDTAESIRAEVPVFAFRYGVYVAQLRGNGSKSAIITLRQATSSDSDSEMLERGRVIYGEMSSGNDEIKLLWDSPIVILGHPRVAFRDVNGDETKEIVLEAAFSASPADLQTLSVFDVQGEELTRQGCRFSETFTRYRDTACPIVGENIALHCDSVPCTISGALDGYPYSPATYWYLNHHYVLEHSAERAAAMNEDGIELMKQEAYRAASVEFTEASNLSPGSALFANNAGFAFYKVEAYEDSVSWLKKAIAIDPTRALAYLNLGDAYAKLNRNAEAREAYQKYLSLGSSAKSLADVRKKLNALPPSP
jgi:hypothetical protein